MDGTVGKGVVELVGVELGFKSLRPSYQKLLAHKEDRSGPIGVIIPLT